MLILSLLKNPMTCCAIVS